MTTKLKLTGLQTYVGVATSGTILREGDVAAFDDHIAEQLLGGSEVGKGDNIVPWFEQTDDKAKYNFATKTAAVVEEDAEAQATATKAAARATRRPAAAAPAAAPAGDGTGTGDGAGAGDGNE